MTVEMLLSSVSAYELTEWAAYMRIRADEHERAMRSARRK